MIFSHHSANGRIHVHWIVWTLRRRQAACRWIVLNKASARFTVEHNTNTCWLNPRWTTSSLQAMEMIITCVSAKSSGRQLQEQIIGYIALHYELDICKVYKQRR